VTSGRVAWSLLGLSVAFAAGGLALWVPTRSLEISDLPRATDPALIVSILAYSAVGALIVSRRFGNRVGWIFLAAGLGIQIALFCQEYAIYALRGSPGSLPGGSWAGLAADLAPVAALALGTFLLLLFPTGQLTSPRFRLVAWLAAASLFVMALGTALGPGSLSSVTGADKPIEIEFPLFSDGGWAWLGTMLALLLAAVSVFIRYRSGGADERQQLRWFLAAAPIFIASFFLIDAGEVLSVLGALGLSSLPIAAGIAIFRYRLYDLDLVLKRTLVYGVATVVLAGLYFGIVLALQQVFSSFAGGSDLAVAVSTLAVAALFGPVQRRIQRVVDRRFYRRRYDAQRILESFSASLRDEIDLDALGEELRGVVRETMQPAQVSLWLRPPDVRT
jgi:hypothetical protein